MIGKIVRRDHSSDEVGNQLADLVDRVRDLEQAAKAAAMSVEDGSIDIYDDDDNLRGRMGKQPDGGFSVKSFGKKPQTPTEPDVIPVPGGCIVEWDGTFEDAQTDDIQRIAIHVGTSADFAVITGNEGDDIDEDVDDEADSDEDQTERGAIVSPRGGSAFLALDPGQETYWIRLTAVAEGGAESDPTAAVEVVIAAPEAAFFQDEFALVAPGAELLNLTYTPLDHSDHLYWNGQYQPEDIAWTRIGRAVQLVVGDYPAKAGDRVVVEYAYNPGEQPLPIPLSGNAQRFYGDEPTYLYIGPDIDGGIVGDGSQSWSLEFLYKLLDNPPETRVIAQQSNGVSINQGWSLYVAPGGGVTLQWKDRDPSDAVDYEFYSSDASAIPADHKAHQYVIRWDAPAKRASLWIDGSERAHVVIPRSYDPGHDMILGGAFFGGNSPSGILDEVSGFPRLLTPSEIGEHFEAWEFGRYPETVMADGPTYYFRMDDLEGAELVFDSVTQDDQGDLQGGAQHNSEPALQKGQ